MRRLIREPLVHFLLLGGALFGVYHWRERGAEAPEGARVVHLTAADVRWLQDTWSRQWQRDPTPGELNGLVTEFLKEELLAREARAMGLDQNDVYVRRRLAQKVEFLMQDTSRLAEPTEAELRQYFADHPAAFREAARLSFTHVFFSRAHAADVPAALARLQEGGDPAALGERLLVEPELREVDEQVVAGQFGAAFARAVFALPAGEWRGPVESGFGLHLVRVSGVQPEALRAFDDVRTRVLDRWREDRQRADNAAYFAGLMKKYDVVVDESVRSLVGPLAN